MPQQTKSSQLSLCLLAVVAMSTFAPEAFAQFTDTTNKVCGFFSNIQSLLSMASVAVVTIAVIFAGYQIAFAHKRIADVAPILVGGLLIGAAGQIASMLLPENESCQKTSDAAQYLYSLISTVV